MHPEDAQFLHSDGTLYVELQKALYGLKDSGYEWYVHLSAFLHSQGFTTSESDPCLYCKWRSPTDFCYVLTHVDDLMVVGLGQSFDEFPTVLDGTFPESSVQSGNEFTYLGMSLKRGPEEHTSRIHQIPYITTLLETFGMADCNPVSSPCAADLFDPKEDVSEPCDKTYFLSLIMSLMYLARISRPDILFPTTYMATKSANPTTDDLGHAKRILRYLKGTIGYVMCFTGKNIDLSIYADASHGIYADGKGHYGVVFVVGNDEVVRMSHKMKCVSLSSTESELVAAVDASTYLRWLIALFRELSIQIELPVTLHQDNQSTIHQLNNGSTFRRSKHMVIKTHFTRGLIEEGLLKLVYTPSEQMLADAYTKPYNGKQILRYSIRVYCLPVQ
jgi:hypothetical protein